MEKRYLHTTVMRNLLSLFLGLLSGFLVMLARAVLLLDRVICRIYDLPLWPRIGRALTAAVHRRLPCALCAFVPVFLLPGALLLQSGTMITVNGRPIGLVEQADTLCAAVEEIEAGAAALSGSAYTLPLTIESTVSRGTRAHFLSVEQLQAVLIDAAPEWDTLAVISVDGERAGVCRSAEQAQTVLDRVKAQYTTATDENAHFMQSVRVESVAAPVSLVSDIAALYNDLSPRLNVTATRAVTYTEHIPYETVTRENDQLDQTYRATVQPGQQGEAIVTAQIETVDGQEHGRTVLERTVLSEAQTEIVEVGTKNVGIGTGDFSVPMTSYIFTSAFKMRWGRLHGGVDLAAPEGSPVYAADNGKVIVADSGGDGGGYGNYIMLDHQNGYKTLYGHNSELLVAVGDVVEKGEKIAYSGNTGNSTGPHLHFEIRVDDERVDPQQYITLA